MAKNILFLVAILFLIESYLCVAPPNITSYTIVYAQRYEQGLTPTSGTEYFSYSTNKFRVSGDSGQDAGSYEVWWENYDLDIEVFSDGSCDTYCFETNVCPPSPFIHCEDPRNSYFELLPQATPAGTCSKGVDKWQTTVTITPGQGDSYNATWCITTQGVPISYNELDLTNHNNVFFSIDFTSFTAGEPAASFFDIPSTCPCIDLSD